MAEYLGGVLFFWVILGALVGAWIGDKKKATNEGLFLGLILGPFGCIIAALVCDNRTRCPHCRTRIDDGGTICPACQSELTKSP